MNFKSILGFLLLLFFVQLIFANPTTKLVSMEKVASHSKEELAQVWKDRHIPQYIAPIKYGVDVYSVIYHSTWVDGSTIKASGQVYIPHDLNGEAPLMVYNHGTRIKKKNEYRFRGEQAICVGFACDGYIVAVPDYFGLGKGEKTHLYQHAESEALSSIDLVRAVREFLPEFNLKDNGQLFLTGYSQGGHACMSTHREIQLKYADEFNVTASSPMSGAYDMAGAQSEAMFVEYSHPGYLPYLIFSYQEAYNLSDNVLSFFRSPYDSLLPPLFDGTHGMGDVNAVLPNVPKDMIKEDFIQAYQNDPEFPFLVKLKENSPIDWVPESPMQICYCDADEQVYYKNALVAYDRFKENGAKHIKLRRVDKTLNHGKCALYAVMYTKLYFDSFRHGSKNGRKGPAMKRMIIGMGKGQTKKSIKKKAKKAGKE